MIAVTHDVERCSYYLLSGTLLLLKKRVSSYQQTLLLILLNIVTWMLVPITVDLPLDRFTNFIAASLGRTLVISIGVAQIFFICSNVHFGVTVDYSSYMEISICHAKIVQSEAGLN